MVNSHLTGCTSFVCFGFCIFICYIWQLYSGAKGSMTLPSSRRFPGILRKDWLAILMFGVVQVRKKMTFLREDFPLVTKCVLLALNK